MLSKRRAKPVGLSAILGCLVVIASGIILVTASKLVERHVKFLNKSGSRIQMFWIHPDTGAFKLVSKPYVLDGASLDQDSYVGHRFQIREVALPGGSCHQETCRISYLKVTEYTGQYAELNEEFEVLFLDDRIRAVKEAQYLASACRKQAASRLQPQADQADEVPSMEKLYGALEAMASCVELELSGKLFDVREELAFQTALRKDIAEQMEDYACTDVNLPTTTPLEVSTWDGARDGVPRTTQVFLDRPASKIHLVENIITEDECTAMERVAKVRMERAMTADGKGGSHLSEHRKAMVGPVPIPWHKEDMNHPLTRAGRRIYEYVNHVLGLGIQEFGQESIMAIQYMGRGQNDTEPDRYSPHCDAECTGIPHKPGNRVATMVLYCAAPEKGGHTNFRNAGVHVVPQEGAGLFFSYIDPETLLMDEGLTEHSGCPVYEGEKKIMTQWIRLGVDADTPWDSFNTLGVRVESP